MMGEFSVNPMGLWGLVMLSFWLLVLILVVLGVVALLKYIFGDKREGRERVYVCAECGYEYNDKNWAVKCQKWCAKHNSCNLEIIKHGSSPH